MRRLAVLLIALLLASACEVNPSTAPTSTLPPTSAPTAAPRAMPTGTLSVSAQPLDTVVRLSWTAAPDAHGYNVYRNGSQTPLNATALMATSYDDIGLTNGRTYTYSIAAIDPAGQIGVRSPELGVAPKAP